MKNWPPVQKASTIIATPEIRPNHQSPLTSRSPNAWMIQKMPTIRNRKPRMSAIAANVFSGLMNAITPGDQQQQAEEEQDPAAASPRVSDPSASCWKPESEEHDPDQHADRGDRSLVELKDHQRDHDPEEAEDQPQPPQLAERDPGLLERGLGAGG